MSKVAISGGATGSATYTIQAPTGSTDRVLTLPDEAGTVLTSASDIPSDNLTGSVTVDGSGRVGVATSSPDSGYTMTVNGLTTDATSQLYLKRNGSPQGLFISAGAGQTTYDSYDGNNVIFGIHVWKSTKGSTTEERMRIDSNGALVLGSTDQYGSVSSNTTEGLSVHGGVKAIYVSRSGGELMQLNRQTNDGELVRFRQAGNSEGSISVSGTTVSYNGGHLARWSRLADDSKDTSIVKGTVMTNLDAMVEWSHDAVAEVLDEEGNVVTEARDAYTEENEQLNKMAVSSVEGDPNVAGVFVNWDEDDDDFNDMNIAMTGDMVIRIAQGTTVQRGDLLMSAGDGTAKPQGDDIVRSKTIAKVTSTHVSHTYDDGSYLVPCVLMAC